MWKSDAESSNSQMPAVAGGLVQLSCVGCRNPATPAITYCIIRGCRALKLGTGCSVSAAILPLFCLFRKSWNFKPGNAPITLGKQRPTHPLGVGVTLLRVYRRTSNNIETSPLLFPLWTGQLCMPNYSVLGSFRLLNHKTTCSYCSWISVLSVALRLFKHL